MVSAEVQAIIDDVRGMAVTAERLNDEKKLGLDPVGAAQLHDDELLAFNRSFNRSVRAAYQSGDTILTGIYQRHKLEIMLGLMMAKQQMNGDFQGQEAVVNGLGVQFGFEAAFVGLGDDWRNNAGTAVYPTTSGSLQNWIHDGSNKMGGTAGGNIKVMENLVLVLLGIALYSQDIPSTIKFQERIDTRLQPVMVVQETYRNEHADMPYKIREFDTPRILHEDSEYRVQMVAERTVPSTEWAQLIGVAYTKSNILLNGDLGAKTAAQLVTDGLLQAGQA